MGKFKQRFRETKDASCDLLSSKFNNCKNNEFFFDLSKRLTMKIIFSFSYILFLTFFFSFSCNENENIENDIFYDYEETNLKQNTKAKIVVNTWFFLDANKAAYNILRESSNTAIDAVEVGCSYCESAQCDGSVGWGSHPDESGETTLDAMIMDGETFNVGAVGSLRRIKNVVSVARKVLENTHHSFLAGELATQFAIQMGFKEESLTSQNSTQDFNSWKRNNCQPNFWTNVVPDPIKNCGPYTAVKHFPSKKPDFGKSDNHDTIGMIAMDGEGKIAAATSTNGAAHKIPGRVGDSPIPGSGAYAAKGIGGAAATGDGDIMLRFLPAFTAVEAMRSGIPPQLAAQTAIERIVDIHDDFSGAVVALSHDGQYGAACHGMEEFPFSVSSESIPDGKIIYVPCI